MATTWPLAVTGNFSSTLPAARYFSLGGECSFNNGVESTTGAMARGAYDLDQLWVMVGTNTRTDTVTLSSRKNAGAGGMSVSIPTTVTGVFEDLVGSDSLAAGDTANYRVLSGGGSGTIGVRGVVARCASASSEQWLITSGGEPEGAFLVHFMPLGGRVHSGSPQSIAELVLSDSVTFRAFRFVSSANTLSASTPITFTINSGVGNQTVTVTAATTGAFEDTTHSDSVVANDLLYYRMDTTASTVGGSVTPTIFQMTANTTVGRFVAGWHEIDPFGVTRYMPIEGRWFPNPTETPTQTVARVAGTASDLDLFLYNNTLDAASPCTLRVGGVASTLTVTAGAATTGRFRDSTHTVAILATDLLATQLDTAASGSGVLGVGNTLLLFDTTVAAADSFASAAQQMVGHNGAGFLGSLVRST